jgi:hypothetical protein
MWMIEKNEVCQICWLKEAQNEFKENPGPQNEEETRPIEIALENTQHSN